MDPLKKNRISNTDLFVTSIGFGAATLGNLYKRVEEKQALATLESVFDLQLNYLDVAPYYGYGLAEERVGKILSQLPRNDFVISTKVGRLIRDEGVHDTEVFVGGNKEGIIYDLSRDGVLRSIDESLNRLKIDSIDIIFMHDPDTHPEGREKGYKVAIEEAYPTIHDLRSQGVIKAIGAGMNESEMLVQFAKNGDFDCFLLAGRYTLIDHESLDELLPLCVEKNISISLGGAYNSGILASDLKDPKRLKFNYTDASQEILDKAKKIKDVCDQYNISLKAAALQFVYAHPAVASVIIGASSPDRVKENFQMASETIPSEFWMQLKRNNLIPEHAPTPN